MRVLAEFAGGALVIGSEQGEVAEGQRELQSLFQQVFAQPARISWEWHSIRASRSGEVCCFFAEGQVVATGAESQALALQVVRGAAKAAGQVGVAAVSWLRACQGMRRMSRPAPNSSYMDSPFAST